MAKKYLSSAPLAIIGAGPSGLALSLFLKRPVDILESTHQVGGHTASFIEQGFTFDYGPHILFSKDSEILDFIVASLGDNVAKCRRNNKVSFKDRLLKYPFENDLKSLPLDDNYACLHDFIFNPYQQRYSNPKNMREWFLKVFGEGLCSRYLFPYNEKVWNIPVDALSMSLAERIPYPCPEDILKSSLGYSTEGYLHQLYYHYPKNGGYQAICEAWKHATTIHFQTQISKINVGKDQSLELIEKNGQRRQYQHVVSTMPLHQLIKIIEPSPPLAIQMAVEQLIVNPMFVISFGLRGHDPHQYTAVYFPESSFWVNRISYPASFSAANAPLDHWSLQAEITCKKDGELWQKSDEDILAHTKAGLQARGLLPSDEAIVFARVDRVAEAYVVYDVGYEERVATVRAWFASQGISLLGRFGRFDYVNVDMAVERALQLAIALNADEGNYEQLKSDYLQSALSSLKRENMECV